MNYALMLADHVRQGRENARWAASRCRARGHGLRRDGGRRAAHITDFVEKPADPPAMPGKPDRSLASMGIYIFNARYLYRELERDMADPNSSHDFGKDIIPKMVKAGVAAAHPFELSCVGGNPASPLTGATSAPSTPTGTPTSTSPPPTRSTCTTRTGRSGPTSRSCRRPSSCTTRTTGAAWPSSRWCPAAASCRAGVPLGAVLAGAGAFVLAGQLERAAARRAGRRGARLTRVVVDRDCAFPTAWSSAKTPTPTPARFYRTDIGHHPGHREMLRGRIEAQPAARRARGAAEGPARRGRGLPAGQDRRPGRRGGACRWRWPSRAPMCACCCRGCRRCWTRCRHARTVIDIGACLRRRACAAAGAHAGHQAAGVRDRRALPVPRGGGPYQDTDGEEWPDNLQRFALLGWVAAHLAAGDADPGLGARGRARARLARRHGLRLHGRPPGTRRPNLHGAQPGLPGPVSDARLGRCWGWRRASCRPRGWNTTASSAS
jgi:hypothetical protein